MGFLPWEEPWQPRDAGCGAWRLTANRTQRRGDLPSQPLVFIIEQGAELRSKSSGQKGNLIVKIKIKTSVGEEAGFKVCF